MFRFFIIFPFEILMPDDSSSRGKNGNNVILNANLRGVGFEASVAEATALTVIWVLSNFSECFHNFVSLLWIFNYLPTFYNRKCLCLCYWNICIHVYGKFPTQRKLIFKVVQLMLTQDTRSILLNPNGSQIIPIPSSVLCRSPIQRSTYKSPHSTPIQLKNTMFPLQCSRKCDYFPFAR